MEVVAVLVEAEVVDVVEPLLILAFPAPRTLAAVVVEHQYIMHHQQTPLALVVPVSFSLLILPN
tara:strand:+ start:1297 stop:1488 length:192 start_codon:yes stop_codon:yes gene_type:complete